MYRKYIKRFLDVIGSLLLAIILSWLFIIISLLIKCTTKGKIIYKQKRIGKDKKEFYILKFRTMLPTTPGNIPTHLLNNPDQYITGIGKILRKTSLDELPQVFNILKGDMSLVGPRPALWNQYDLIAERDLHCVNDISPGLTGWAQVNGRDELPINVKAKLDGEYVMKLSFWLDAQCILKTFGCVWKQEGVREGMTKIDL
jgi:O-antigen biosynthesis protein WbqP